MNIEQLKSYMNDIKNPNYQTEYEELENLKRDISNFNIEYFNDDLKTQWNELEDRMNQYYIAETIPAYNDDELQDITNEINRIAAKVEEVEENFTSLRRK